MPVLTTVVRDVMVAALGASRHMAAECLGSASLYGRHHFELAETDMTRIGLPICRTILPKDISHLQPRATARQSLLAAMRGGQPPGPLLQSPPDSVILQLPQHLVRADRAANGFGRDMCVARRRAELGMPQKHLDHPNVCPGLQQMRGKAVAQGVQRGGLVDPSHMLGGREGSIQLAWRQGHDLGFAGKQPALRARFSPIISQQIKQPRREHCFAIFVVLALIHMDQHPVTVDVRDLEIADFRCPQTSTIADPQGSTVF